MGKLVEKSTTMRQTWYGVSIVMLVATVVGVMVILLANSVLQTYVTVDDSLEDSTLPASHKNEIPQLEVNTVLSGLSHPWDVGFLPDGQLIFTERQGQISLLRDGKKTVLYEIPDVKVIGEGGLLGLAVDPQFAQNRYIYACFNSTNLSDVGIDVRVVRWKVNGSTTGLESRNDIITNMPSAGAGRHSGCRLAFGPDGYLWIGTGDAAQNHAGILPPQDPKNLGGKILRVDRDGRAVPGNLGGAFDDRIYSYGHRNVQGIAFLPQALNGVVGFNAEHGPDADDEINPLSSGNFGWDPGAGYNEQVPMTDKQKFPNAIEAVWKSGVPTQAPSGLAVVTGTRWQAWNGALAVAMLKAQHLKILRFDGNGKIINEDKIITDKGRLRAAHMGPDGSLYITTDNGNDDAIIRLTPKRL
jgi:glucose/arabinose dehydrogenase